MTNEEAIEVLKKQRELPCGIAYNLNSALDLAIKVLETGEVYMTGEDYNLYMEGYKAGKKDFEPKQGEWIRRNVSFGYVDLECSLCHCECECIEADKIPSNYCPNCGADMRGDDK